MNEKDKKAMVEWSETAQELARIWFRSMRSSRSRTRLDEDDIRDFLIDLWLKKGGVGAEFDKANRGQLYNYVSACVGNSRDALSSSYLMSELRHQAGRGGVEEIDEDHFNFLSCSDSDGGFDDEPHDEPDDEMAMLSVVCGAGANTSDGDLDGDLNDTDKAGLREALDQRLEELAAILDTGLSGALAEIFGTTGRTGRTFAHEIRREKMLALIVNSARKRGMKPAEVKKLAAGVAMERRKTIALANSAGGDVSYAEVEAFEEMMGLTKPAASTATTEKTRSRPAKAKPAKARRKSMVQMHLGLVEQPRPSSAAGSLACRLPGPGG